MKTWGNWPLDDSLSHHFREPWIICSVGNPEEWRMQGFWATKWGYHGNLWENMWIHCRLSIHFLGDVTLLGAPWLSCVQDDASPEELEEYNLKLEAGDHRSTVEMGVRSPVWAMGYSLWTLSGQKWESLPPRKCQFVTHGPMGHVRMKD